MDCAIILLDRALLDSKSDKEINATNLKLCIATRKLNVIFERLVDPILHLTAVSVENSLINDFYHELTSFTVKTAH